jgi:hemerythrin-like metal-binding protein
MFEKLAFWGEHTPIGIPEMDEQHRGYFGLLDQVCRGLLSRESCPNVECVVLDLEQYVQAHFVEEEALMARYGYPGLQGHMESHAEFSGKLAAIANRIAAGEVVGLDLLRFLSDWWSFHIGVADRHYANFILNQDVAEAA